MYRSRLSFAFLPLILFAPSTSAQVTASAAVVLGTVTVQAGVVPPVTLSIAPGTAVPSQPLSRFVTSSPAVAGVSLANGIAVTASAVTLNMDGLLVGVGSASASLSSEVLLFVTSSQPVRVAAELEWTLTAPLGTTLPVVQVDFDNNGSVDIAGQPNVTVRRSYQLGTTSTFLVRSIGNLATTVGTSTVRSNLVFRIVPDYQDVVVFPILSPCGSVELDVGQTFVRGVSISSSDLVAVNPLLGPTFLVIGFTPQLVPMPATPLCFLLPSTDIVIPFPRTPLVLNAAAAGPLQFFVQGVWLGLSTNPMMTTNGEYVRF